MSVNRSIHDRHCNLWDSPCGLQTVRSQKCGDGWSRRSFTWRNRLPLFCHLTLPLDCAHPERHCRLKPSPRAPCLLREARSVLIVQIVSRADLSGTVPSMLPDPRHERMRMTGNPAVDERSFNDSPLSAGTLLDGPQPADRSRTRSTRLTVNLPKELVDRLRDTVYWIPQLTLSRLVEEAIDSSLAQLETANRGRYPRRTEELKPGRPRSTRHAERIGPPSRDRVPTRATGCRIPAVPSCDQTGEDQHARRF